MTSSQLAAAVKIMLGTTEATAMYIGSTLVWYKQQQSEELPYDCQIEYLQSTGIQHIITELYGNDNMLFEAKFNITDSSSPEDSNSGTIFGARQASNDRGFQLSTFRSGTIQYAGSLNIFGEIGNLNTDYTVSISSTNIYVNDVSITTINTESTFTTPCLITLFALNQNSNITEHFKGKIYYIKIYNKSTLELIADFIPVRVGQIGYMYDKISGQLFGNDGSGVFTLGPDIIEIEYLESSGTQYIDTGILITGPYKAEIIFETPTAQTSGYSKLMGIGNESNAAYQYCILETDNTTLNKIRCSNRDSSSSSSVSITLGSSSTHDIIIENSNNSTINIIYNEVAAGSVTNSTVTYEKASAGSLYLFTINNILNSSGNIVSQNSPTNLTSFKLHAFKFYLNNKLIRDMIPVRIGQTGYMYDKISDRLFENKGTGNFILPQSEQESEEIEFIRLEYIEVDGNQHINTGIVASEYPLKLHTEVYINNVSNEKAIWGNNYDQAASSYVISSGVYNGKFFSWGGSTSWQLDGTCSANTWYEVEFGFPDVNTKTMVINGTNYSSNTSNGSTILNEGSIYLFFNGRYTNTRMNGRMKYAKLYVGNVLVRDFIPVRVGQVGYMYDKISKQLFENLGTGSFILGPDIVEVEYLQSSGTQYIETGIIPDSNTGIYLKASQSGNADNYAVGLRNSSGNTRWCIGRSGNGWYWGYGSYDSNVTSYLSKYANIVECKLNYLNDSKWNAIGDNNTSAELTLPTLSFTPSYNIRLFGSDGVSASYSTYAGKIYAVKISQDSNIVMDLIPVRIGQIGYMYDKVSNKLFGNSGTESFTLGPDIDEASAGYIEGYVQYGLIFHLDGINKGVGSDWTDLIGGVQFTSSGATSMQDSYYFSSSSYLNKFNGWDTGSDDFTVEVCYYYTGSNSIYSVFGFGGGASSKYPLFYKGGNYITWIQGGYLYDCSSFQTNSKYTVSLNNTRGLVNGNSISILSSTDYWSTGSEMRIGKLAGGGAANYPFNGYIYSIRIYNRRLSQAEQLQNQQMDNQRFNLGLSFT